MVVSELLELEGTPVDVVEIETVEVTREVAVVVEVRVTVEMS